MANEWNKTALVADFETMLRRHLRSGAAPVTACAGFDLDTASAYLEGALGGSPRAGYESHLAGCAVCRRHLIELSRLALAAPRVVAQPVTVTDQSPAGVRWREVVDGWFDLSSWKMKWRIAGAAGAAFAILIAALGVQTWRQASNRAAVISSNLSATPPPVAEIAAHPLQSSTPEPPPQDATTDAGNSLAFHQQQSQVPAPAPRLGIQGNAPNPPVNLPELSMPNMNQLAEAPVAPSPTAAEASPPRPGAFTQTEILTGVSRLDLKDYRLDSREQNAGDAVRGLRITPPRYDNPMNPGQPEPDQSHQRALVASRRPPNSPNPDRKPQPNKSILESVSDAIKRLRSGKLGFTEPERKAAPDALESAEADSSNSSTQRIKGKVFHFGKKVFGREVFGRDMWIDEEYKDEQEWNIRTLKRGSEPYKQVLADEPQLKEFFDHAPILVVWKDRIYKVRK